MIRVSRDVPRVCCSRPREVERAPALVAGCPRASRDTPVPPQVHRHLAFLNFLTAGVRVGWDSSNANVASAEMTFTNCVFAHSAAGLALLSEDDAAGAAAVAAVLADGVEGALRRGTRGPRCPAAQSHRMRRAGQQTAPAPDPAEELRQLEVS